MRGSFTYGITPWKKCTVCYAVRCVALRPCMYCGGWAMSLRTSATPLAWHCNSIVAKSGRQESNSRISSLIRSLRHARMGDGEVTGAALRGLSRY